MKRLPCILALLVVAGCTTDDGSVLTIRYVPAPTTQCTYDASSELMRLRGFYDPSGVESYLLPFNIVNNAEPTASNVRSETRHVVIQGFDVCWTRVGSEHVHNGEAVADTGLLVDCTKVPANQRGFFPSTGFVSEGGGADVAVVSILDADALKSLFGDDFDLRALTLLDSPIPPTGGTRNTAWGDYPESASASIVVTARAHGTFVSGGTVMSQWFSFPVDVCVLCVSKACGIPQAVQCDNGSNGFEGFTIEDGACEPFYGVGFECEAFTTCAS